MKKRIISFVIILVMMLGLMPTISFAETTGGTCGENLKWDFNYDTQTLKIYGTGDMYDFGSTDAPWKSHLESIKTIVIQDGVTSIGESAFELCSNLTSVTIADSVTEIGDYAFYFCDKLASITIADVGVSIGYEAFYKTAYYNDEQNWIDGVLYIDNHLIKAKSTLSNSYEIVTGTKSVAECAFEDCTNLSTISIPSSMSAIKIDSFYDCSFTTINYRGSREQYQALANAPAATNINCAFENGFGTEADPYIILNGYGISGVRYNLDAHFRMENDDEYYGWYGENIEGPIGTEQQPFTGVFDANNCFVSLSHNYAFFEYNRGIVKNINGIGNIIAKYNYGTISNCKGDYVYYYGETSYLGGVAIYNYGTISNCSIRVLEAYSDYCNFAGIAAFNYDEILNCFNKNGFMAYNSVSCAGIAYQNSGRISNCYNTFGFEGQYDGDAAGIACYNSGVVENCYNTGDIYCYSDIGGSCSGGIVCYNSGTIKNCYNTGNVCTGADPYEMLNAIYVGGIVAKDDSGIIENCYNIGVVTFKYDYWGAGLSEGYAIVDGKTNTTITNCYYLEGSGIGSGINCTTEQMQEQSTYVGFDFDNIWKMFGMTDYKYPILQSLTNYASYNAATGVPYNTFEDALNGAQPGETIELLNDVEITNIIVDEGITVDLNGYSLIVDKLVGYNGSSIVDNSADKSGRLYMEKSKAIFAKDNSQLAIYDSENGCFAFSEIRTKSSNGSDRFRLDLDEDTGIYTYSVSPVFGENEAARTMTHKLLNQTFEESGVTVEIHVTWRGDSATEKRIYVYNDSTVKSIVNSFNTNNYGSKFAATFKWSDITDVKKAKISTVIRSDTGIEIQSEIIDIIAY